MAQPIAVTKPIRKTTEADEGLSGFSTPEMRKQIYDWVKAKGDPQYMEVETPEMSEIFAEAQAEGWRFLPVGTLRNATCYKMEKP